MKMKDKVLVRVRLPMADLNYDVRLPADISVSRITDTLYKTVQSLQKTPLPVKKRPILWSMKSISPLQTDKTLREQGVTDSDMLFLI